MKGYKIISFLLITAISLTFCAMKQEFQTEFPQEIQSIFYQKIKKGTESSAISKYKTGKNLFSQSRISSSGNYTKRL
jgi:hypothetical protein